VIVRNAVTGLMRGLGYGKGCQYAHDFEGGVAPDQTHLPPRLAGRRYYIRGVWVRSQGWGRDERPQLRVRETRARRLVLSLSKTREPDLPEA
jgi:hypothetical protein